MIFHFPDVRTILKSSECAQELPQRSIFVVLAWGYKLLLPFRECSHNGEYIKDCFSKLVWCDAKMYESFINERKNYS